MRKPLPCGNRGKIVIFYVTNPYFDGFLPSIPSTKCQAPSERQQTGSPFRFGWSQVFKFNVSKH